MYIIVRIKQYDGKWEISPGYPPTRIHRDYTGAQEEARRLAQQNPGAHFAIFEFDKAATCEISPVDWVR